MHIGLSMAGRGRAVNGVLIISPPPSQAGDMWRSCFGQV